MQPNTPQNPSNLSVIQQAKIADLRGQFEADWQTGHSPSLEKVIDGWHAESRAALLRELVLVELRMRGQPVTQQDLLAAHPALANEIAPLLADLEQQGQVMSTDFGISLSSTHYSTQAKQTPAAAMPAMPDRIGKYRVIALLDSGGQGLVYRVAHPELASEFVIKINKEAGAGDERRREKLISEGRLLAQLNHPNLARVVDLDFHEGKPFVVMEFVRGQNLQQYVQTNRPSHADAARLVAKVARGLAAAHAHGIVHRDIKPQNIIIDPNGEPRVIDFGLAQLRDAWSDTSDKAGTVSGTVQFMAPEQARGENDRIDARTDVFALGAVLYWLLTGKAPFAGANFQQALQKAAHCDFDTYALHAQGVPAPLADVCHKAMSRNPGDRHSSAGQLADALESCLEAKRSRVAAIAAACLLVLVGGFIWWIAAGPSGSNNDNGKDGKQAQANKDDGKKQKKSAKKYPLSDWALEKPSWSLVHTLRGHGHNVQTIAFDSDGDRLVSGAIDGTMKLWNVKTGECLWTRPHPTEDYSFYFVDIGPNDKIIASSHYGNIIRLWDFESGKLLDQFGDTDLSYIPLQLSPDGSRLAAAQATIQIWDVKAKKLQRTLEGHLSSLSDLSFNSDGTRLASALFAGSELKIWDVDSGECRRTIAPPDKVRFLAVDFHPDGKQLAAAGGDAVTVWDVATGELLHNLNGFRSNRLKTVVYSPNGEYLAAGGNSQAGQMEVRIWHPQNANLIETIDQKGQGYIQGIEFSPDSRLLAITTAGREDIIQIWTTGRAGR